MILHVKAEEGADIPKMDAIGKSDPYLVFNISNSSKKLKTQFKRDTHTPVWKEEFHIPLTEKLDEKLHIELYDKDVINDDLISSIDFQVNEFPKGKIVDQWYIFTPTKHVYKGGKIHLIFHLTDAGKPAFTEE